MRSLQLTIFVFMLSVFCSVRAECQSDKGKKLDVTPGLLNINGPGGKLLMSIKSDGPWQIVVQDKWIKCDTTNGKFSSTVVIKVEENFNMKARLGKLSVISGDLPPVFVEIVQKGQHGE